MAGFRPQPGALWLPWRTRHQAPPLPQGPFLPATVGRGLFIVDNSVSGWTGLRYLEEWSGIAKAFDIATGYFEIGAGRCGPATQEPVGRQPDGCAAKVLGVSA